MNSDIRIKDLMAIGDMENGLQCENDDTGVKDDGFAESTVEKENGIDIPIEYMSTEEIIIPEIKDVHGRLSDMIADIEDKVGIAVIPFEMVGIANEVVRLQRYEIFTISGKKYAMSKVPRERVMSQFLDRIVKTLSNGLPFNESLVTSVDFEGKVYKTLTLSQVEWNTILSKLRSYKQRLYICNHSDVIMEVLAERV
jgi:hypothetical protein